MDLMANLQSEIKKRQMEEQRRMALEKALAVPLQTGRVTLNNGRIGISGSVLFAVNSDALRPDGRQLLKTLVAPLQVYLGERNEMLMVSGFTDDKPIQSGNQRFSDNLELSAQRALTVTRTLVDEGMPSSGVFAAAFGLSLIHICLHPSLRHAVRLRIENERGALPGPALTPYLVGLLVMLGMLCSILGMVVTVSYTHLVVYKRLRLNCAAV